MLVDPEIWPVVCQEITAVWIVANHGQATAAAGSSGTSAQINHAPQGMPMSNILPNTMANTSEPASASFPGDRKERTIALKEFWGSDTLVLKVRGNVTIGDVKYAVYAQKPAYRTKGICIYHSSRRLSSWNDKKQQAEFKLYVW
ncbi:hypothetical protein M408DRAFT_313991 [Serendipita vermifera MAFF 305830]|uniref:Uncharacterized protein n=1 Tax=Serendipita vermifera MAFF 305830 TaxID=933852 RepID=A0A0C2VZA3_SERVB|nr:hypothetical protein M408DRAFT_313991 [Serendipita vermifera MAFF 305830]